MKENFIAVVIAILILFSIGVYINMFIDKLKEPSLFVDKETGCNYYYNAGAITPRLDASGMHICDEVGHK